MRIDEKNCRNFWQIKSFYSGYGNNNGRNFKLEESRRQSKFPDKQTDFVENGKIH